MNNQASFPPTYNDPVQKASENLRQALPLINKHKIPVNPANYAVWYEYVSGDNIVLIDEINARLSDKLPISTEFSQQLFEKYILMGMPERLESTHTGLKLVVDNTLGQINKTEADTAHSINELNHSKDLLNNCRNIDELHNLVSDILASTQMLTKASNDLKQDLVNSSHEITKLKAELEVVKEASRTDGLTGLLNRGAFNHELNAICEHSSSDVALAIFDLDHFKNINDTYGHVIGDKILQYFSDLLQKHAGEHHLVARYGGEEIAMVLMNITLEEATTLTDNIRLALAETRLKKKGKEEYIEQVTVSVGLSMLKKEDLSVNDYRASRQSIISFKKSGA